jgi:hypothetical protein
MAPASMIPPAIPVGPNRSPSNAAASTAPDSGSGNASTAEKEPEADHAQFVHAGHRSGSDQRDRGEGGRGR